MKSILRLLTLTACLCSITTQGHAESTSESLAQESAQGFRLTLFNDWGGPQLFTKGKGSEYQPLDLFKMAYSAPYKYTKGEPIVLYSEKKNDAGKSAYVPLLNVDIPAGVEQPLLVVFWSPSKNKGGVKVIDFSTNSFPYGSYQIVNLGEAKIGGFIGSKDKKFVCEARKSYTLPPVLKNGDRTPIVVYSDVEGSAKLVYSTMTIHREKKRVIFFLAPEKNKLNRVVYRSQSLVDFNNTDSNQS